MMNLEVIRNLPSKSLLPRPQDVTHITTIGAQVDLDQGILWAGVSPTKWIPGSCMMRTTPVLAVSILISVDG